MKTTVEISMYPLREDYEKQVLDFLGLLHSCEGIQIKVNGMSTQVLGTFEAVSSAINNSMKNVYEQGVKACFVVKYLPGAIDLDYRYSE